MIWTIRQHLTMLILDLKTPVSIVLFVLRVWDLIPLTDAYDTCDVRHRFVHETECRNKLGDEKCNRYAALGYCIGDHYENMFIQCKRSCGFCIAADLYEEVPKRTCYPEKHQKYEMMTQAKMICANDPSCSGLVEAPKRRGQQKKFGRYSLTEREYILCGYPLSLKATNDTLLLIKRGPTSLCARQGITDLSTYGNMHEGGWDLDEINQ